MIHDTIMQWANRHSVPPFAISELFAILMAQPTHHESSGATTEVGVMQRARLEAARSGALLMRNNVGACRDHRGRMLRYGLANDSKQVNAECKSSDMIGIQPVVVQPEHVGETFGLFLAVECKKPGWKYTGKPREKAQKRFLDIVRGLGGIGRFQS